jgi:uncharacterized protein
MLGLSDTPGVYIQRQDRSDARVSRMRTDIAAFVGIAEAGPLGMPVRVQSMRQFEAVFGSYTGSAFLAYSVRAFFENGGRECLAVRVATDDPAMGAAAAERVVRDVNGDVALTVSASSPGTWGNGVEIALAPAWRAETQATDPPVNAPSLIVLGTDGFAADQLVRVTQFGLPDQYRVLAAVDPASQSLHFVHPEPLLRKPRHAPLTGLLPAIPVRVERLDYDLTMFRNGMLAAVYAGLSLVPDSPRYVGEVLREVLPGPNGLLERVPEPVVARLEELPAAAVPVPLDVVAGERLTLGGGRDGLSELTPAEFKAGLAALSVIGDVSILAVPDILVQPVRPLILPYRPPEPDPCAVCPEPAPASEPLPPPVPELPPIFSDAQIYEVQSAMIEQCERLRDRVALIDPPWQSVRTDAVGLGGVQAWRLRFDSAFGGLYLPWLAVPDPLGRGVRPLRYIPPSGHVAGQLAASDLATGPHRAAANTNLEWVQAPSLSVEPAAHGLLNSAGLNVIGARNGRPLRILGARTVSSDPLWLFFPVRRFMSMLRRSLDAATQWAVFEPNSAETRTLLTQTIGIFLESLRRGGALAGAAPAEAFRVRCDESNNPASSRARGELFIDIAVAPAKPLEFIVLRLSRVEEAFELREQGALAVQQVGAV